MVNLLRPSDDELLTYEQKLVVLDMQEKITALENLPKDAQEAVWQPLNHEAGIAAYHFLSNRDLAIDLSEENTSRDVLRRLDEIHRQAHEAWLSALQPFVLPGSTPVVPQHEGRGPPAAEHIGRLEQAMDRARAIDEMPADLLAMVRAAREASWPKTPLQDLQSLRKQLQCAARDCDPQFLDFCESSIQIVELYIQMYEVDTAE